MGLEHPRAESVVPLRVCAAVLAVFGIFPLAAVIKYAAVVQWLPQAGREWLVATSAVVVVCLVAARVLGDRADSLLESLRALLLTPSPRNFAAWTALIVLTISLLLSRYESSGLPVSADEISQLFQAGLLLRGRLSAVPEVHQEFVGTVQSVTMNGRWFAQFPIGGPALLAPGAAMHAAWLVNPVLAAWTASSFYRFASRITDEVTARGATLLFVFNPFVALMSATQMNHAGSLAFLMFALAALAEWTTSDDPRRVRIAAMYVGVGVAAIAILRPYEALLVAAPIAFFQFSHLSGSPIRQRSVFWQIGAGLPLVAFQLFVNHRTTGDPLLFGYDAVNGITHRPGFHVDPTGNDFTLLQGLHHISSYLIRLNLSLFDGPIPGLVLVVLALMLIRTATRWDYLLIGIIGALMVGFTVYWSESFMVGAPRFLYLGVPAFLLFVARLPAALMDRLPSAMLRRAVAFVLPISVVVAWALPPGGPAFVGVWPTIVNARTAHAETRLDVRREVNDAGLTDALVIVHEGWHGRLTSRLREIGVPALTAESMVSNLDACALQRALEAEDSLPLPNRRTRVNRVVTRALMAGDPQRVEEPGEASLALVGGRVPIICLPQLEADSAIGKTSFDLFVPYQDWDADGRLGGRVVFVRDYGNRNRLLLDRFGDRTWYRYRPRKGPDDASPVFIPYRQPR